MVQHLRFNLILLFFSVYSLFISYGQTQPLLTSDENHRAIERPSLPLLQGRMEGPDTLRISGNQSFFEDFSQEGTSPDPARWFNPEFEQRGIPQLTRNSANKAPSRGVASFDGLDAQGIPYDTRALSFGKADLLLSHYIDLSGFTASDRLLLSFQLQAGGKGEAPEAADSFFVSFLTPTDTFLVYSQAGGASEEFSWVSIPLNNPAYFQTAFQLAFENKGSLNGALDVWHLDYIELGPNRSFSSSANDQSAVALLSSPLAPYTAIPLKHFPSMMGNMQAFDGEVNNLSGTSASLTIQAELTETFLNTQLSPPFSSSQSLSANATTSQTLNFPAFAEQNLSAVSVLNVNISLANTNDAHPENDGFSERFPIDSVLSYDDGEADMGFGLNRSLAFGVKTILEQPDSISAVWISFVPTLNFNPVSNAIDYMEGKSFRFRVWNFPHPDSILYEQVNEMKVNYGTEPNEFIRYPLNRNIPVSGTFWVGIQQLTSLPIGVGYDMSYNNDAQCFYDSSGVWRNIDLGGTLMIRPEFHNTTEVVLSLEESYQNLFHVYPNPIRNNQLRINANSAIPYHSYKGILLDIRGKKVFEYKPNQDNFGEIEVVLPAYLEDGMYIWQHVYKTAANKQQVINDKVLLIPRN